MPISAAFSLKKHSLVAKHALMIEQIQSVKSSTDNICSTVLPILEKRKLMRLPLSITRILNQFDPLDSS